MAERCPECARERVETMEAFWKNPSYSCPADIERTECNDDSWVELQCARNQVSRLQTRVADLEAVFVQAQRLRRAVAVHQHDYSCLLDFDNAVARTQRSP